MLAFLEERDPSHDHAWLAEEASDDFEDDSGGEGGAAEEAVDRGDEEQQVASINSTSSAVAGKYGEESIKSINGSIKGGVAPLLVSSSGQTTSV